VIAVPVPVPVPVDRACVFCAIVGGRSRAHLVLEDETCLAFLDIRPLFPGHTLVVPRAHREALIDLARDELQPLFRAAQVISAAMGVALATEGTFVALNDRVSQSVPHIHLHVVPRRKGDGLRGFFWPRHKYSSDEEAAALAEKLRSVIVHESASDGRMK
jgi:histidine triad (HIT) family protein